MRRRKDLAKWVKRKMVQLLVILLIVGQIAPMSVTVYATDLEFVADDETELDTIVPETEQETGLEESDSEKETEEVAEEKVTVDNELTIEKETATEEETTVEEGMTTEEETTVEEEMTTEEEATVEEEMTTEEETTVEEEMTTEEETTVEEEMTTEEETTVEEEVTTEEITTEGETGYVRLVLHAPTGSCEKQEILVDLEDKEVNLPDCYMDGYVFVGWYLDEEGTILFQTDELYWIDGLEYDLFAIFEEEEKEVELEERMINMSVNGVLITVSGKLPLDAYLQVTTIPVAEDVKKEIVRMSDSVESMSDLNNAPMLYSYDISICWQGQEYEPHVYGEEVEVRFTYMARNVLTQVDYVEVFHVNDNAEVECVEVTTVSDYEVVVKADEFSQYIVIGQVNHSYETHWDFGYQENIQDFQAPVKGIYKIELFGAQGGHYSGYQGGLGGMVTAYVELEKNQIIEMTTGGQNSFHGGNQGTVSNGGGATELRIAGELAAIAGGGGGAGTQGDGGKGGLSTETQKVGNVSRGAITETFGGGAGYQNGQDGYVLMHEHTGNAAEGGGCYTKTSYIYHSHKASGCKYIQQRCNSTDYIREGWWPQVQGENPCEHAVCRKCAAKHTGPRDGSAGFDSSKPCGNVISQYWDCGKTENALDGVEFTLGCEKDETTVDGMVMSTGGSNFYHPQICKNVATAAGANEGNGRVAITLMEIDAATIYYYESATQLLTSVSVEKGTMASYPLSEIPQREADSKYSYTFAGWDNMATQEIEKLQGYDTVQNAVSQDRSYMAVYDKTPRSYTLTLQQEGADVLGSQQATAQYGIALPEITIPQKEHYIFAGYYTGQEGSGTRVYREDGTGEQISYFEAEATLYAYWITPLAVTKHPTDVTVQAGYSFAIMEADAILTPASGYTLSYQWYVSTHDNGVDANKIEGAVGKRCTLPTGYQVGSYSVYCEITGTSAYNGQQVTKTTKSAKFTVEKGNLSQGQLILKENHVIYDGKPHTVELEVQVQSDVKVYYAEIPLTKENYQVQGTIHPKTYTDAGTYAVYVYVTSANYQDFAGVVTLVIEKAEPMIYLANRNVAYNKKQQGIGNAVVYGICENKLDAVVEYVYYTDEACTQPTTREDGAIQTGDKPSKIGTYYVQAKVKEAMNYKEATLLQPAMLNIIATKSKFSVKGYHGIYDGKPHGVQIEMDDEDATTFWFSDKVELTEDNYQQEGVTTPYQFKNPGRYKVYYMAVTKITGWIYDYSAGDVMIVIESVSTNHGNGNDNGGNGNENNNGTSNNGNAGGIQGGIVPPIKDLDVPDVDISDVDIPLQPQLPSDEDVADKIKETEKSEKPKNKVITQKNTTENEEIETIVTSTTLEEAKDTVVLGQQSDLLMILDCLDKLTPQELELLQNYLKELNLSEQKNQKENDKIETTDANQKMVMVGVLGLLIGGIIGAGAMFMVYPSVYILFRRKCCVKGICTERAQHMNMMLETKEGTQKIEKKKNGTFCLPSLQKGETYLLKGTIRNGKTFVLMKIQPQTWEIQYECAEIAGLQIQVKERRGGLRIVIQ